MHSALHIKALNTYLLKECLYRVLMTKVEWCVVGVGGYWGCANDLVKDSVIGWICLPNFICWNWVSSVIVIEGTGVQRWLGQKGGAFMNGISALIQEVPESSPNNSAMWGQSKKIARLSQGSRSGWCLDLVLSVSRTMRNECCLEAILSVVFCYSSVSGLRLKGSIF